MLWVRDLKVGDLVGLRLVIDDLGIVEMRVYRIIKDVLLIREIDYFESKPNHSFSRNNGKCLHPTWKPTLVQLNNNIASGTVINLGTIK